MQTIGLAHPADLEGFRHALRRLVAAGTAPDAIVWQVAGKEGLPLAEEAGPGAGEAPPLRVPRRFASAFSTRRRSGFGNAHASSKTAPTP
jgi:DNA polymerase